jgi:hypothetical protein
MQQQAAPKVLVSVDDAEAGTAQLHRNNSAKRGEWAFGFNVAAWLLVGMEVCCLPMRLEQCSCTATTQPRRGE